MLVARNASYLLVILFIVISNARAFVTIVVEVDPHVTSTQPACSTAFIKNFESNLTAWVENATQALSFLSDFTIPGGFHLTYQDASVRRLAPRSLRTSPTCSKCTSSGCSVSCGIGLCRLCGGSRRHLEKGSTLEGKGDNETAFEYRKLATADWTTVGIDVTNAIQPMIIYYASVYSGGCLGDNNLLGATVAFESDVPIDATMSSVIIAAFGVAATAPPPNTAKACCTMDFTSCVNYCGTTQQQCQSCAAQDVGWMPKGPPSQGSCIARWNNCISKTNSCCPGMQCIGDQYWKGCFYVPQYYASSTKSSYPSPVITNPSPYPIASPTRPPSSSRPTSRITSRPTSTRPTTVRWSWHA